MKRIMSLNEVKELITSQPLVLLLIKTEHCGVCDSVQAKLPAILDSKTNVTGLYLFMEDASSVAAEYLAFSAPTLLLFYNGKEVYRIARFVRFDELEYVLSQYEKQLSGE